MKQTLTQEEVVAFVYGELDAEGQQQLRRELLYDFELREEVADLRFAKNELPKVTFSPKKSTLEAVLEHSRSR